MTDKTVHEGAMHDPQGRGRELLSALMDGETSEHELRQALRALGEQEQLARTWARYHVAQSAMRGEAGAFTGVDLRAAIAARLDEPAAADDILPGESAGARGVLARLPAAWLKPLASVAVAASVALATVFTWQAFQPAPVAAGAASAPEIAAAPGAAGPGAQTVALGPMVVVRADGDELVLPAETGGSPTAAQDRLNAYLARHAQAASASGAQGLSPYARVVSLEGEQGR